MNMDERSPEVNLWSAVLLQYFADSNDSCLSDQDINTIRYTAQHDHTKNICEIVNIDHKLFLEKLDESILKNESRRSYYRRAISG